MNSTLIPNKHLSPSWRLRALRRRPNLGRAVNHNHVGFDAQHPVNPPASGLPRIGGVKDFAQRLAQGGNLRQDVASIYWEFERMDSPSDEVLIEAAQQLIETIERLWH